MSVAERIPVDLQHWADRAVDDLVAAKSTCSLGLAREDVLRYVVNAIELGIHRGSVLAENDQVKLPIPMLLHCPCVIYRDGRPTVCGARHVDEGEFETRPHRTHTCQECGGHFQPALVPTVGVKFLPGCKNSR